MITKLHTDQNYGHVICGKDWECTWSGCSYHRFYYVLGGKAFYSSQTQNLEFIPGNLYILPSFTPYKTWHDPKHLFEVVYFHIEIIPDITEDVLKIPVNNGSLEHSLLNTFWNFADKKDLQSIEELCPILVRHIIETYSPSMVPYIVNDPRLDRVIRFIEQNRDKKITIENLARTACMERAYFTRYFKKHYMIPPMEYVRRRKMSLASAELLLGASVGSIAQSIAYEDDKAFSRAFKQVYGIAPLEYRKSHNLQPFSHNP
ncbi:hypothetical protein FACS189447_02830 [Spirochaetia bacterium]|nr:hypothetical protein FACS189447_02830 [Spirochaetia bacterium]